MVSWAPSLLMAYIQTCRQTPHGHIINEKALEKKYIQEKTMSLSKTVKRNVCRLQSKQTNTVEGWVLIHAQRNRRRRKDPWVHPGEKSSLPHHMTHKVHITDNNSLPDGGFPVASVLSSWQRLRALFDPLRQEGAAQTSKEPFLSLQCFNIKWAREKNPQLWRVLDRSEGRVVIKES